MWQDNLVPGGILGLISVWYMFCFLTAVFGWKSQMNVCSKEDWWAGGWWAAGLQTLSWMGCWHSWIPSCRDLANSQRYREEKQKSPNWVGSSAESCKFLPHCTSKEAPTHWPLLLECYPGQFMISLPVQLGLYNVNVLVMKQMWKRSVRSHHTQFNLVGVFDVCTHWPVHSSRVWLLLFLLPLPKYLLFRAISIICNWGLSSFPNIGWEWEDELIYAILSVTRY